MPSTPSSKLTVSGDMARVNLISANREWTISGYGTSTTPNNTFNIADETAGLVRLCIDTNGNVAVGTTTDTGTKFRVVSSSGTHSDPANSSAAGITAYNSNNSSITAHAFLGLRTGGDSGGNAFVSMDIAGVSGMSFGLDNADGNVFKLASSWTGTFTTSNTKLKIDYDGVMTLYGGSGGAQLNMSNGGDLVIYNGDNSGSVTLYCDTSGRLNVSGSLQLAYNNWTVSSDGWRRLYFAQTGSTLIEGGSTSAWSIEFRTQNDDATHWLMHGGDSGSAGQYNFWCAGNIIAYWSDQRLKKNINKISDWREIINGVNGYRFQWNDLGHKVLDNEDKEVKIGLLAQEVKQALPQAAIVQMLQYKDGSYTPKDDINYDPEDPYLTVQEEKFIPVLIEAVKGLMEEVEQLKSRISELESR